MSRDGGNEFKLPVRVGPGGTTCKAGQKSQRRETLLDSNDRSEKARVRAFTNEWYDRHGLDAIYAVESADYGQFSFGVASVRGRPEATLGATSLAHPENGATATSLPVLNSELRIGESRSS
jgi:hypothetical protein